MQRQLLHLGFSQDRTGSTLFDLNLRERAIRPVPVNLLPTFRCASLDTLLEQQGRTP